MHASGEDLVSPLPGEAVFTSSVGEYRRSHLHAGVDLSTGGRVGIPVRAMEGGRVVRVLSSPRGYGNAVYVLGDDGRLYVYAHLSGFSEEIEGLLPRPPHPLGGDADENVMEVYPPHGVRVERGEVVGASGESGGGLAHLHFEVRLPGEATDTPINPWDEGILPRPNSEVRIEKVFAEPAAPAPAVPAPAVPVAGDVHPTRLLVQAVEATPAGDRMAPARIYVEVFRAGKGEPFAVREVRFHAFRYGADRDHGYVYDLARSGFEPTTYVFDLTGPTGGADVIARGGVLDLEPGEYRARVEVTGNSGRTVVEETSFRIPLAESNDFVTRAGILRDGKRVPFPDGIETIRSPHGKIGWTVQVRGSGRHGAGRRGGLAPSQVMDVAALRIAVPPASAASLPPGAGIAVYPDETIPRPAEALRYAVSGPSTVPRRIEPEGLFFAEGIRVEVPLPTDDPRAALYEYRTRRDRWEPVEADRRGDVLLAKVRTLRPLAVWVDAVAPRFVRGRRLADDRIRLYFRDDLSGVEKVEVRDGRGRPVRGRWDGDWNAWISDEAVPVQVFRWTVRDRAGNERTGRW